ncbi:unnamed protein product, partial [Prorocentrum cordatum]
MSQLPPAERHQMAATSSDTVSLDLIFDPTPRTWPTTPSPTDPRKRGRVGAGLDEVGTADGAAAGTVVLVTKASFCGGKVAFAVALVMIGALTAVIGDMATLLGCVLDIPAEITAATLVALGTSLPDTFASLIAAQ